MTTLPGDIIYEINFVKIKLALKFNFRRYEKVQMTNISFRPQVTLWKKVRYHSKTLSINISALLLLPISWPFNAVSMNFYTKSVFINVNTFLKVCLFLFSIVWSMKIWEVLVIAKWRKYLSFYWLNKSHHAIALIIGWSCSSYSPEKSG